MLKRSKLWQKKEFIKLNNEYKINAHFVTLAKGGQELRGNNRWIIKLENGFYYEKKALNHGKDVNYYLYNEKDEKLAWNWTRKEFINSLIKYGIIKEA